MTPWAVQFLEAAFNAADARAYLGVGSGVPEAPIDGTYYARFNATWAHLLTANGATTGLLSSADWTTFNNKQPAGTYLSAASFLGLADKQSLVYNGSAWLNARQAVTPYGGLSYYFDSATFTPGTGGLLMGTYSPTGTAEQDYSAASSGGTQALIKGFCVYDIATGIGLSPIPAGEWAFDIWAYADIPDANNFVYVEACFRRSNISGTVTITGAGTSRTATYSGISAFVAGDANAQGDLATWLETPTQLFQIIGFTSGKIVTIATPVGYVNEAAVAFSQHRRITSVAVGPINSTTPVEYVQAVAIPAVTPNAASAMISFIVLASYSGGAPHTLHCITNGPSRYSHVHGALATLHAQLLGLQGGNVGQMYHLTLGEYNGATGANKGLLLAADWTTFNNKLSDAPSDGNKYVRQNGAWVIA